MITQSNHKHICLRFVEQGEERSDVNSTSLKGVRVEFGLDDHCFFLSDGIEPDADTDLGDVECVYVYNPSYWQVLKQSFVPSSKLELQIPTSPKVTPTTNLSQFYSKEADIVKELDIQLQNLFLEFYFLEGKQDIKRKGVQFLFNALRNNYDALKRHVESLQEKVNANNDVLGVFNLDKTKSQLESILLPSELASDKYKFLIDLVREEIKLVTENYAKAKDRNVLVSRRLKKILEGDMKNLDSYFRDMIISCDIIADESPGLVSLRNESFSRIEEHRQHVKYYEDAIREFFQNGSSESLKQMNILDEFKGVSKTLLEALQQMKQMNVEYDSGFSKAMEACYRMRDTLSKFKEQIKYFDAILKDSVDELLPHLKLVHSLPENYELMLQDIQRRKDFKAYFQERVSFMNRELRGTADGENRKRSKDSSRFAPFSKSLVPALNEKVPICCVQVIPFDEALPVFHDAGEENFEQLQRVLKEDFNAKRFDDFEKAISLSYFGRDANIKKTLEDTKVMEDLIQHLKATVISCKDASAVTTNSMLKENPFNAPEVKQQVEELQRQLAEEREKNSMLEVQVKAAGDHVIALTTENFQLKETCAIKEQEIEEYKQKNYTELLTSKDVNIETLTKEKAMLQTLQKSLESQLLKLTEQVTATGSENALLVAKLDSSNNALETEKAKNKNLSEQDLVLSTQLADLKEKYANTWKDLQRTLEENKMLQDTRKSKEDKILELQQFGVTQAGVLEKYSTENVSLAQQVKLLQEDCESKRLYLLENAKHIQVLQNSLNELKSASSVNEGIQKALQSMQSSFEEEKRRNQKDLGDIRQKYDASQMQAEKEHKAVVDTLKEELKSLKGKLQEAETVCREQSVRFKELQMIVTNSSNLIAAKSSELLQLNNPLNEAEKLFKNAAPELKALEDKSGELIRQCSLLTVDRVELLRLLHRQLYALKKLYDGYYGVLSPLTKISQLKGILKSIGKRNDDLEQASQLLQSVDVTKILKEQQASTIKNFNDNVVDVMLLDNAATGRELVNENSIVISNFQCGDRVLFFKTNEQIDLWECFNINTPNYFLDIASVDALKTKHQGNPKSLSSIMGTIVMITKVNDEKEPYNPFKLKMPYHLVLCEFL